MTENERKQIPVGLAMSLAMNEFALEFYGKLDEKQREKVTNFVQSGSTGMEAKERIDVAVKKLSKGELDFLY